MTGLWSWAVDVYGRGQVAALCLDLQDMDGQNVPLLLWAAWLGHEGIVAAPVVADAAHIARQWSESVIGPLRLMRRRLKSVVSQEDEAVRLPLREKIKSAELEAERALMSLLEPLSLQVWDAKNDTNHTISELILENLRVVAAAWSQKTPDQKLRLLSQALS
ncbi:TIGR02444 family protein [Asticcacaulis sp. 201]|uniref:TIGR02444 family protein n=1 Tax=Asticcacaulis sp. 201 TaxID=3028787 RepID=UPI002916C059|nr:TIGR02444 family protein [Asticcacaulis sp. 201]MDV6332632.1 TIGR02444 family protein [Asticcacaulis sp. 201]